MCLAEITADTIRIPIVFNDPVLHVCGADVIITNYNLSWTTATGKETDFYSGPYPITGSAISATALSGIKASAAQGRITMIYIDNIEGTLPGGGRRKLTSKFYKVVE